MNKQTNKPKQRNINYKTGKMKKKFVIITSSIFDKMAFELNDFWNRAVRRHISFVNMLFRQITELAWEIYILLDVSTKEWKKKTVNGKWRGYHRICSFGFGSFLPEMDRMERNLKRKYEVTVSALEYSLLMLRKSRALSEFENLLKGSRPVNTQKREKKDIGMKH